MISTELQTFDDFEFEKLKFPLIVVYKNPKDYPEKFAARLYDVADPTPYVIVKDSLMEIRGIIPRWMVRHRRHKQDDPVIVEVYF